MAGRDRTRATDFAAKHGVARVHDSYDALVADPDVDAIYNPLPNGLHGRWTAAAIEAGKHVLCEKPFAADADEAEQIAAATAGTGLVVMEAFHYRYHPFFARVLELAATLGPLRDVSARMIALVPDRHDIRYRLDLAGGATMDVGCYAIHQLRTVVGSTAEGASSAAPTVTSARAKVMTPGVDRAMRAELAFGDRVTATMECALLAAQAPVAWLRVVGEEGRLQARFPTRPQLGWITTRVRGGRARREQVKGGTTFEHQLAAFRDAVVDGRPTLTPPADAAANLRVIDDVYRAAGLAPRSPTP